jgi:hypothetical protein
MTTPAPPVATTPAPSAAQPPPGPPPTIVPNRQRLDNRFPVLAFAIRTNGRPLFEVLLATDRALFDPANASRRTPSNFYAGRQDGGLARAIAEDTAFVVPAAALRRFADAKPRPGEIYYTVAAYQAADGPPALAQPVAMLATTAPYVLLGRDFAAQTLAHVLSVPVHKLVSAVDAPPPPEHAPAAMGLELDDDDIPIGQAQTWTSQGAGEQYVAAAGAWDDEREPQAMSLDHDDELDGPAAAHAEEHDETYGAAYSDDDLYEAQAYGPDDDDEEPHGAAYADDEGELDEASHAYAEDDGESEFAQAYDDGYGDSAQAYAADEAAGITVPQSYEDYEDHTYAQSDADDEPYPEQGLGAELAAADDGYDDGYGYGYGSEAGWAGAAASDYPAGSSEPATLADVDDDSVDRELVGAAAYEDYGSSYGNGNGSGNGVAALAAPPFGTASSPTRELDIPTQIGIVAKIGRLFETRDGFRGINADSEFSTPGLPQHGRWHVGLTYGLVGFTQDSGLLGRLLALMRTRDADAFAQVFGPDAGELLRVTSAHGPSSRDVPGGRGPRVQPVGGADLWTEPWLSRFRRAAEHPPFQAAQNQLAVQAFLHPMLPFARGFGLDTERALAMIVDRAIHMGAGGARRWLTGVIGPVRTDAQRQQALSALRIASLRELQQAAGLHVDGSFGPLTHAALVGALRRLGPASPVPIPTRDQLMDAIVARADGEQVWWRQRPATIRTSPDFADGELTWTIPAGGTR